MDDNRPLEAALKSKTYKISRHVIFMHPSLLPPDEMPTKLTEEKQLGQPGPYLITIQSNQAITWLMG